MIKSSKPASSGIEPRFHNLTESKTDMTSSVRSEKLESSIKQGGAFVSTEAYLRQIESKYEKMAQKQKKHKHHHRITMDNSSQFMLQHHDNQSYASNYDQFHIPDKFQKSQKPKIQAPPQAPVQVVQSRIISNPPIPMNIQAQVQVYNSPPSNNNFEDVSLSRGVSERGAPPAYTQEDKNKFFDICTRLKGQLPLGHKGRDQLTAALYQEIQKNKIPQEQWESWVRVKLQQS